jgi:polysaccharide pyruvyl transferase WcaK-like protein
MIHHVFANRSNIGDWLSARGVQHLLRPHAVSEHLCDDVFLPQTLEALRGLDPQDLVVIGGGGLFMDYFEPFWRGLLGMRRRLRYVIWGVGFCDLKSEPSLPPLDILRAAVEGSELCVLRDEQARVALGGGTLPMPVACPSLVEVDALPPGRGVLHVDNYTTVGARAFDRMDRTCRDFAARTNRPYRRTNNRIEPGREDELARVLNLYAQSDLVVSSALHGCIVAVAMGRPVLAVSGDRKIEAFMTAAGLGEWVLDHEDLGPFGPRLETLAAQPPVLEFVELERERNRGVAARVAALADAPIGSDGAGR